MSGVYTVVIRGGTNPPNRVSGDATDGVYRVDWNLALPKKYNQFRMSSLFRNKPDTNLTTAADSLVCVECSAFPKQGFYDTKTSNRSNLICVAPSYFSYASAGNYLYNESLAQNPTMIVGYPSENMINVKLTDLSGATLTATRYTEWVLILNFEPVI